MSPLVHQTAHDRALGPESAQPPRRSHIGATDDLDLMAGLWQEAPFARLPDDAPPELHEYVQDVENPRRVYAIHRASRRHDFQLLVDRYVYQLRNGCGAVKCITSTCFTCRKRLVGKAPIRRYNPTSARTLAVYLASQDNPEAGLCPNLRRPKETSAAVNGLIFTARPRPPHYSDFKSPDTQAPSSPRKGVLSTESRSFHVSPTTRSPPPQPTGKTDNAASCVSRSRSCPSSPKSPENRLPAEIKVSERPVGKDHRSFAATAFGTVAFKMLEWLTPQGVAAMSERISELNLESTSSTSEHVAKNSAADSMPQGTDTPVSSAEPHALPETSGVNPGSNSSRSSDDEALQPLASNETSHLVKDNPNPRRNSQPTFRRPSSPKSSRGRVVEGLPTSGGLEEIKPTVKAPSLNGFHPDKPSRTSKPPTGVISRVVSEIACKSAIFEDVPRPDPPITRDVEMGSPSQEADSEGHSSDGAVENLTTNDAHVQPEDIPDLPIPSRPARRLSSSCPNYPLSQSLIRLNVELIDFICDIYQEDHTSEQHIYGPASSAKPFPKPQNPQWKLTRKRKEHQESVPKQWKVFNEQAIFSVLSDPHSLVQSFTTGGKLYDSHTLWYCMLRMTRVTPSLVLHSLWIAAGSLFEPPKILQSLPSATRKPIRGRRRSLSDFEAGCVMSACLHALVAAASFASDSKTLYEMSRIRSNGLALAGTGRTARQSPSICLEYDDVFSNDLAMRLARRLFCAITARRCFAEMTDSDPKRRDKAYDPDILWPLLNQLDLLACRSVRVLEFTQSERLLHETRVPTLLLDWARAVLLQEWDGQPEFSNKGSFHGALSLMATMYDKRNMLLLGDVQFRVDYFSERLDMITMPVAWTGFTSTRQKQHILDYPYLFSPDSLVSFFRSINFARMSRMFEESSSLKTRMSAIVDPGSLITNPHHKFVLQDLLRTASSRYLVLEIGRDNVLRDAFDQLWRRQGRELLRPLKVHLGEDGGEEGFDSGGVQQEFFRMAIAECLDQRYGAFTVDERTRMAWFVPGSIVETWKFELVGLLVSLAVYNGLTLPITFPKALYRKLLGHPVEELYHIADGWPELASGLTTLLEWDEKDGQIEDVFARTYEFSVSAFGSDVTCEMTRDGSFWPQGPSASRAMSSAAAVAAHADEAPLVTNDNRDDYVSDYIRYLADVSVRPQYLAFERGFRACLDPKSLSLLSPPILQSVVEGVQDIDMSELRRCTRYVGWDSSHHTIKDFWTIVKKYDDVMKRKLLEFVTASDRVPVGGMRNLQFVLQKNGEEEGEGGHLPTAYTCYGTLLLPEYRDKDVLRERLGMALQNAQGFGFA